MQFENSFLSIKFYVYPSTDLGVLQHQAENPSHVLQKKKKSSHVPTVSPTPLISTGWELVLVDSPLYGK